MRKAVLLILSFWMLQEALLAQCVGPRDPMVSPVLFTPVDMMTDFQCPAEAIDLLTNHPLHRYVAIDPQEGPLTVQIYGITPAPGMCSGMFTIMIDAVDSDGNCAANGPLALNITLNDNTAPTIIRPTGSRNISDCPYEPLFDYGAAFVYNGGAGTLTFNGPSGPVNLNYLVPVATDACTQLSGNTNLDPSQLTMTVESDLGPGSVFPCSRRVVLSFRATDACGNATVGPSQVTPNPGRDLRLILLIRDTERPTFGPLTDHTITTSGGADCQNNTDVSLAIGPVAPGSPYTVAGVPFNAPSNTDFDDNCSNDANMTLELLSITTGTPGVTCSNFVRLRWRVTDECGRSTAVNQTFTILDDSKPELKDVFNDMVNCNQDPSPAGGNVSVPYGEDGCGYTIHNIMNGTPLAGSPLGLYYSDAMGACTQNPPGGNLNGEKQITRTWYAVDSCGNVSDPAVQTITVKDQTAPNFACPADVAFTTSSINICPELVTITLTEDQVNPIPMGAAFTFAGVAMNAPMGITDDCGSVDLYVWEIKQSVDTCFTSYWVTWRAVDECGNSKDCTQHFMFSDDTGPIINNAPGSLDIVINLTDPTGPCPDEFEKVTYSDDFSELYVHFSTGDSIGPFAVPTASDNCRSSYGLPSLGFPTRTVCQTDLDIQYTFMDGCFNMSAGFFNQHIRINNLAVPFFNPGLDLDDVVTGCPATATAAHFSYVGGVLTFDDGNGAQVVDSPQPGDYTTSCAGANMVFVSVVKDVGVSNNCFASFTLRWQINDNCSNSSAIFEQTVIVEDDVPPHFITFPSDVTDADCIPDLYEYSALVTYADNCSGTMVDLDISDTDNGGTGCVGNPLVISRKYKITDACNYSYEQVQTITVIDDAPPVFTNTPPDLFFQCLADVPAMNSADASAENGAACVNNDPATISVDQYDNAGLGCPSNPLIIHRVYTARDLCGNEATYEQHITVVDTEEPDLALCAPSNTIFECAGSAANEMAASNWNDQNILYLNGCASDNCNGIVTVSSDYDFGNLVGACGSTGTLTVVYTVEDACGNDATYTATFTIVDTTDPAWDDEPSDETVECDGLGNTVAFNSWLSSNAHALASDDCGSVNITPAIFDQGSVCSGSYFWTYTFTATDACGRSISKNATFTIEDTTAPTLDDPAVDYEVDCNASSNMTERQIWLDLNAGANASDECSSVTWTYAAIDSTTGCGNSKSWLYEFTAEDACGNSISTTATFSVIDTIKPDILVMPHDSTVSCDANGFDDALDQWLVGFGGMVATDDCGGVLYSFFQEAFVPDCGEAGTYTFGFVAVDACNNRDTVYADFTVVDDKDPVLVGVPANTSIDCNQSLPAPANVTAEDCDPSVLVTYSQTFTPVNAGGVVGYYTRTWSATDLCGNGASASQVITVTDSQAPTISGCPANIGPVSANGAPCVPVTWPAPMASDNCVVTSFSSNFAPGTCFPTGTHTVTYTATDGGGNTSTCSFTVTVNGLCPVPNTGTQYYIHRFVFNGVANTSGNNGGYANFSGISGTATAGQDMIFTFIPGSPMGFNVVAHWAVWVDFNLDGDFLDPGEMLVQERGNGPFIKIIKLPATTPAGTFPMRVYMNRYKFPLPCENHNGQGEAEDYTLVVNGSGSRVLVTEAMIEEEMESVAFYQGIVETDETDAQPEEKASSDFRLFPNPASMQVTIDLMELGREKGEIQVLDQYGKLVYRMPYERASETVQVDVSYLPQGIYFARVMTAKQVLTKQFVVSRNRP